MAMGRKTLLKYRTSALQKWQSLPHAKQQLVLSALYLVVGLVLAIGMHRAILALAKPTTRPAQTVFPTALPSAPTTATLLTTEPDDIVQLELRHDVTVQETFVVSSSLSFVLSNIVGHHSDFPGWHLVSFGETSAWYYNAERPPMGYDVAVPTAPEFYNEVPVEVYIPPPAYEVPAPPPLPVQRYSDEIVPRSTPAKRQTQ